MELQKFIIAYLAQILGIGCALYIGYSLIRALTKKPRSLFSQEGFCKTGSKFRPRVRPFNKNQLEAILQLHEFEDESLRSDSGATSCAGT
jgi:hypothetical protein